jgi:hypothetical protein
LAASENGYFLDPGKMSAELRDITKTLADVILATKNAAAGTATRPAIKAIGAAANSL